MKKTIVFLALLCASALSAPTFAEAGIPGGKGKGKGRSALVVHGPKLPPLPGLPPIR